MDRNPPAPQRDGLPPPSRPDELQRSIVTPFDSEAFTRLADDLNSHDLAVEFLTSFTALLDTRIRRIEQTLRNRNKEDLITALLSLRSSAAMVGACQLHASTTQALAEGETAPVGPLVRRLQGQAHLFMESTADLRGDTAATSRARQSQPSKHA